MTAMSKMLYMVIERFKEGAAPEIDQRFRGVAVRVSSTETYFAGVRRGERFYSVVPHPNRLGRLRSIALPR